jgi:hypothetical protein
MATNAPAPDYDPGHQRYPEFNHPFWVESQLASTPSVRVARQDARVSDAFAHKDSTDQDLDAPILAYALQTYVSMLLFALQEEQLASFHVLLLGDGTASVRINDQPNAWSIPRSTRSFDEGESIYPDDLEVDQMPLREDVLDIPFIRGRLESGIWELKYKLAYPPAVRENYYEAAVQFLRAATSAEEDGLMRAFLENAFHAAEHLARAELLSYPPTAPAVMPGARHKKLSETFNLWAKLQNTDADYKDLFNNLHRLRPAATYLEAEFALSADQAKGMLATLFKWQWWVQSIIYEDGGTDPVRVVATREIDAGSLVRDEDYTIRQPKKAG